jgi:hypothetical protein
MSMAIRARDRLIAAPVTRVRRHQTTDPREVFDMAKDHGSSVKDDKQYEGLRKKGQEQVACRGDRQLVRLVEPGRQEQWQQPQPEEQRQRQRRQ